MKNIRETILILMLTVYVSAVGLSQVPSAQKLDPNMALRKADSDRIVWFDPREEPMRLTGLEWIKEEGVYRRLPIDPDWQIPKPVDQLANHTAGAQVRFRTDSRRILVKVKLRARSGMYHMPATGQSGFDLYIQDGGIQRT